MSEPIRQSRTWDWRASFTKTNLKSAQKLISTGQPLVFTPKSDRRGGSAVFQGTYGQIEFSAYRLPVKIGEITNGGSSTTRYGRQCSCSDSYYRSCVHEAAFLLKWEETFGPFTFSESDEEMESRIQMETLSAQTMRVGDLMNPPLRPDVYFHGLAELQDAVSTKWEEHQALPWLESRDLPLEISQTYLKDGTPALMARFQPKGSYHEAIILVGHTKLLFRGCDCVQAYYRGPASYNPDTPVCRHQLVLISRLCSHINTFDPGDDTDQKASELLKLLSASSSGEETAAHLPAAPERRVLRILPELSWEETPQLSFFMDLGNGKKPYSMKNLDKISEAIEQKKEYEFSKQTKVDFAADELDRDSLDWLPLIQTAQRINQELNGARESAANRFHRDAPPKALQSPVSLAQPLLFDAFFDIGYGKEVPGTYGPLILGHIEPVITLEISPLVQDGVFTGAQLTGSMPRFYDSGVRLYLIRDGVLSCCTPEEKRELAPFLAMADSTGKISCRIGKKQFTAFYYRMLPKLAGSSFLHLQDLCRGRVDGLLPPRPEFTFRLDQAGGFLLCDTSVTYGDVSFSLPGRPEEGTVLVRDAVTEQEIQDRVNRLFPLQEGALRAMEDTPENLYALLVYGIPALSESGLVLTCSALSSLSVRPVQGLRFSLSLPRGTDLLDLALLSPEADPEELLEILRSYREKKNFYRWRNGDILDLAHDDTIRQITEVAEALGEDPETLLQRGLSLPQYRALYVNQLLEEHDALSSSRDRALRQLIKSFKTISDSDYEVPAALEDKLRPYQAYGYKWLRTLTASSFGGILADDMGLGKTLQMLSLLYSLSQEENPGAFLVVCPASLVYNWKEEARRFTPDLPVQTVAGTLAQRKALLKEAAQGTPGVLYVTSYDLVRRDAALYQDITFQAIVLDEAQFIKNARAGVTKAVKTLKGLHRYALTGTPIENRLLELWSIFDFLMPGFLYSQQDFASRFETPISRRRDEAAAGALGAMTGPFILRRLKKDVLKDLPDKLEEVRTTVLEGEQKKLYDAQVLRMRGILESPGGMEPDKIKILAEITRLRQICCDPSLIYEGYSQPSAKREALLDLIRSAMDGGHRMLVFSQFTSMLSLIEKDLNEEKIPCFLLTGSTGKEERLRLVQEFNSGDVPVFLISLKAGGTGLNLTGADIVIHYDPWWNLSVQNQATDRAHRIGQTKTVQVYKLIAAGTIEEKIVALQEEKKDLADAILNQEARSLMSLSREELLALLQ